MPGNRNGLLLRARNVSSRHAPFSTGNRGPQSCTWLDADPLSVQTR